MYLEEFLFLQKEAGTGGFRLDQKKEEGRERSVGGKGVGSVGLTYEKKKQICRPLRDRYRAYTLSEPHRHIYMHVYVYM